MHKMARAWVAMHQALRAVESVNRYWASSLGLNPEDVLLLLALAKEDHTPSSLGIATGRQRQQVHRSLLRFERVHLAEAVAFARQGRVTHWRLTQHGKRIVQCLERRMEVWEKELDGRVNVEVLVNELRGVLRTLVNQKLEGYFAGLYIPSEFRKDPNLEFLREAETIKHELAALALAPPPAEARKERARRHAEACVRSEEDAALASFRRLWI